VDINPLSANGSFVRCADLHLPKMLRDGRMAALVKLRCSGRSETERQQRAENADAATGSFERR
jgi:hypothetical protein